MAIISEASGIALDELGPGTPIGDAGINSITFIEIVVKLEQELDIELEDEALDLSRYEVVSDLLRALDEEVGV
ncbi:Phosphopantetheine attachment site [compost metagenome]